MKPENHHFNRRRFIGSALAGSAFGCLTATPVLAQEKSQDGESSNTKKVVLCSTTQVADFARRVVGDQWEVLCVLGAGEDPHKYSPSTDDMFIAGRADLCLENGWHLEGNEWMKTLAKDAGTPLITCIEGIQPIDLDDDGTMVKDPHAWFDPRNAWSYTKNILKAVSAVDPGNAESFEMRAELFKAQLLSLDKWITQQVNAIPQARRVLVTHHDAFGYFCKRYKFKPLSPLGWTTSELAGLTMVERKLIVDNIVKLNVKSIFIESTINSKTLEGIAESAGVKIGGRLYSDAMGAEGSAGETYLGMMRENVISIVTALK